jgi:hypothetical protein
MSQFGFGPEDKAGKRHRAYADFDPARTSVRVAGEAPSGRRAWERARGRFAQIAGRGCEAKGYLPFGGPWRMGDRAGPLTLAFARRGPYVGASPYTQPWNQEVRP